MSRLYLVALTVATVLGSMAYAQTSQDESQIRDLVTNYTAAWDRSDGATLASFYAKDGDLITPDGNVFLGFSKISNFYNYVFSQGYKGSKGDGSLTRLRFVDANTAVGDGLWSITGVHDKNGNVAPAERGVFSVIAVKQNGRWLISALREQTSATSLHVSVR